VGARFHAVVALAMTGTLASLSVWSLWSGSTDLRTSRLFATAVPVGYWAPFFLAPLVPGTGVDDPPHPVPRVAGVPTSGPAVSMCRDAAPRSSGGGPTAPTIGRTGSPGAVVHTSGVDRLRTGG